MSFITYKLQKRLRKTRQGITEARHGILNAIIKEDHDEAPAQIYCEFIACRLAALVGVNVASGVLVAHDTGLKYASLVLSQISVPLVVVDKSRRQKLLNRYPAECASLAVFDIWIGNTDRLGNVKAVLDSSSERMMVGIDHGCALLNCDESIEASLRALECPVWPRHHSFIPGIDRRLCEIAIGRIESLDNDLIYEACYLGASVGSATINSQTDLADVLCRRATILRDLVFGLLKPKQTDPMDQR